MGFDTEKAIGSSMTGISTRAGDLLSVRVRALTPATLTSALMPNQLFVVLHNDCMLEISDSGTAVYD